MDESMSRFAQEVRARRRAQRLTNADLSERTGLSRQAITNVEQGVGRWVRQSTREALERVLGQLPVTPDNPRRGTPRSKPGSARHAPPLAALRAARAEALAEVEAAKASLAKAESMLARLDAAIAALGGG